MQPLYVLSFFSSFLLAKPGEVLNLGRTGYRLFLIPFSNPVIILFLGGFILAIAIRKYHVDRWIIENILSRLGTSPKVLLFGYLFTAAFFSMWISNTAATAMMLLLIQPILQNLEKDDPFKKAIVLAIAFGANIGGIGTPIGTPPNAIALGILAEHGIFLDFLSWVIMAVPLAIILLVLCGFVLLFFFPPKKDSIQIKIPKKTKLSMRSFGVIAIACLIVVLWLTSPWHKIPEALTALLGIGLFSAFQFIGVEDLKEVNWDILILMWGGLALGEAMQVSGLVEWITQISFLEQYSFMMIVAFCLLAIILSSFISNTATANILLPIVISFPLHQKILLSITIALSCSFVFAFPVSTPPNAMAYSTGVFTTKDIFRCGWILSIISLLFVLLGFEFVIVRVFY